MVLHSRVTNPQHTFTNFIVALDDWSNTENGDAKLENNKTDNKALVKFNYPVHAELLKVTVHYSVGAKDSTDDTKVTISVHKVKTEAGGVTTDEIVAEGEKTYEDNAKENVELICNETNRGDDYSYFVKVKASTSDDVACSVNLVGATISYQ